MLPTHVFRCLRPVRTCFNFAREFSRVSNARHTKNFCISPGLYGDAALFRNDKGLILHSKFSKPPIVNSLLSQPFHTASVLQLQLSLQSDKAKENLSQMMSNMKNVKSCPSAPFILGIAGVLPFVGPPLYFLTGDYYDLQIAYSQLAYGAAILSFLGGVRWGFTIPENSSLKPDWKNLCYSVAPPLMAWISLQFPLPLCTLTIAAALGGMAYYDNILPGYPAWFKALRTLLSLVAIVSLLISLLCSLMLEHDSGKKVDKQE